MPSSTEWGVWSRLSIQMPQDVISERSLRELSQRTSSVSLYDVSCIMGKFCMAREGEGEHAYFHTMPFVNSPLEGMKATS
jgi:hypothetical protein